MDEAGEKGKEGRRKARRREGGGKIASSATRKREEQKERERERRTDSRRTPHKATNHRRTQPRREPLEPQHPHRPLLRPRIQRACTPPRMRRHGRTGEDGREGLVDPRRGVAVAVGGETVRVDRAEDGADGHFWWLGGRGGRGGGRGGARSGLEVGGLQAGFDNVEAGYKEVGEQEETRREGRERRQTGKERLR